MMFHMSCQVYLFKVIKIGLYSIYSVLPADYFKYALIENESNHFIDFPKSHAEKNIGEISITICIPFLVFSIII